PVCINTPAFVLTGGAPAGGTWSGTGVTGNMFDPAVAGIGTVIITYSHIDVNGCSSSDSKPLTVNPLPSSAGAITGTSILCQGATGMYSVPGILNATTYNWNLMPPTAGTITGSNSSISISFSAAFTGIATLNVAGFNGCGPGNISPDFSITVNEKPVVSYTHCTDSVTTFNAKPFALKGGLPLGGTYSGPGASAGIFNPAVAGTGNKTILYTYTNTWGCTSMISKTITVVNAPLFSCGSFYKDVRDNRNYLTIQIGSQCWMAENLNYGIQITSNNNQRDNCIPEKFCYAENAGNCTSGGGLYEWDELMTYSTTAGSQGLCPPAWHIPTEAEWNLLYSNFINNGFAASALKYSGFSGFNSLISGTEHANKTFDYNGFGSFHWSSTVHGDQKAWAHGMNDPDPSVSFYPSNRNHAFSVRCVKN
ncbi:MAG: FISUMP domain-containing protein, partial [Syntrophothermus sp.]